MFTVILLLSSMLISCSSATESGITRNTVEDACRDFGLVFDGISKPELGKISDLQSFCNISNVLLVKDIDGRFFDRCLYLDHGAVIFPGNSTFCFEDSAGALCRKPPEAMTSTATLTLSSITIVTTFSMSSSVLTSTITVKPSESISTFTTVIGGSSTTIINSDGSPITTITMQSSTLSTVITGSTRSDISSTSCRTHSTRTSSSSSSRTLQCTTSEQHLPCQPDILCQNDEYAMISFSSGASRRQLCRRVGMDLAEITIQNFMEATAFLFRCLGAFKKVWIGSYNGDPYEGYCIALYSGNEVSGGAIAAPNSCHDAIPILCKRKTHRPHVFLKTDDNARCDETAEGIHIISGLYGRHEAFDHCHSVGLRPLDIGNHNIFSLLGLAEKCHVQYGWVRSVHSYSDTDGMLYFAHGSPVLGAAMVLSDGPGHEGILGPVFCQEGPQASASSASHTSLHSMTTVSETVAVTDTVTTTVVVITPVIEPTIVIRSD